MANQNTEATKQSDQKPQGMAQRARNEPAFLSVMPFDLIFMNPFTLMRRMTEEMDRAFQNSNGANVGTALWVPAIEVSQREGQYVVRAELPGLKPEDVQLNLTDEGLVLEGERKFEREVDKGGIRRTEMRYGRFYRLIPLPDGANADQVRAKFENGVLEVTVPLAEEAIKRRRIQVETSTASSAESSHKAA
jgi:HSP20 family protein